MEYFLYVTIEVCMHLLLSIFKFLLEEYSLPYKSLCGSVTRDGFKDTQEVWWLSLISVPIGASAKFQISFYSVVSSKRFSLTISSYGIDKLGYLHWSSHDNLSSIRLHSCKLQLIRGMSKFHHLYYYMSMQLHAYVNDSILSTIPKVWTR